MDIDYDYETNCYSFEQLIVGLLEQLSLIILINVILQYYPKILFNFSLSLMEFIDNLLYCNNCSFVAPNYNSKEIVTKVYKTQQSHSWEFVSEKETFILR